MEKYECRVVCAGYLLRKIREGIQVVYNYKRYACVTLIVVFGAMGVIPERLLLVAVGVCFAYLAWVYLRYNYLFADFDEWSGRVAGETVDVLLGSDVRVSGVDGLNVDRYLWGDICIVIAICGRYILLKSRTGMFVLVEVEREFPVVYDFIKRKIREGKHGQGR